jgi:dephospho-CoA kinase
MRRIGLTGNIASGKSAVARVWTRLGAVVVDADDLARAAVARGTPALVRIAAEFGDSVLRPDGALDRAALRRLVFGDVGARRRLEAIVHPEVTKLRALAEAEAVRRGAAIVVHDIPLLFETGLEGQFDQVVLVDAPEPERLRRLVELRGLPPEEALAMVRAQMPAAEKRRRSDLVLDNSGTLAELEEAAADAWRTLAGDMSGSA